MPAYETKIYLAILISAILMVLFIASFVSMLIRHQRNHIRMYQEKLEAEVFVLEKERKRVASDLHDGLGPLLSAVKLYADSLKPITPNQMLIVEKIKANIKDALEDIHTISNDLLPNVLTRMGLVEGIRDITKAINRGNQIHINYSANVTTALSTQLSIHIYRILMEIIANTITHAQANTLTIDIFEKQHTLLITTRDDGIGYEPGNIFKQSEGLGLKNILSRVELLNGDIFTDTKPNLGTRYEINIPILPTHDKSKN